MDRIARRMETRWSAERQTERYALMRRVEAMVNVGYKPTFSDYVVYHCYTYVLGNKPLQMPEWLQSIGGTNELARGIP